MYKESTKVELVTIQKPPIMKASELLGKKFGKLTVLKIIPEKRHKNFQYLCQCDCGHQAIILQTNLKRTISCGCAKARNTVSELGKTYFYLKVIEQAPSKKGICSAYWKCKCICGNFVSVKGNELRRGAKKSCGCMSWKFRLKDKDITGPKSVFRNYKSNAKIREIEFALTLETFTKFLKNNCYFCGTPPSNEEKLAQNRVYTYSGIDRLNSSLGYAEDNCVSCCVNCNLAKNDLTTTEFKSLIVTIYNNWAKHGS